MPSDALVSEDESLPPELSLMRAVLNDGARVYRETERTPGAYRRRRVREIHDWFASDTVDWPFSFVNICRALQLDPEDVRQRVARVSERPAA